MIEDAARKIALDAHEAVNHKYAGYLPYRFHLEMVVNVAKQFIDAIPEPDRPVVLSACWLHDTLEDTHLSYYDLFDRLDHSKIFTADAEQICEIVYAVTNKKGRNRAERANDKYYKGIGNIRYATFVKLCDRLANILFSKMSDSSMLDMYRKENGEFLRQLEQFNQHGEDYTELKSVIASEI